MSLGGSALPCRQVRLNIPALQKCRGADDKPMLAPSGLALYPIRVLRNRL